MVLATSARGLGAFLSSYEAEHPEEVLHIERPVDAKFQVTAIIRELERQKCFPVLVFHNVLVEGQRSEFPLVTFLMSSRLRLARLLGAPIERAGLAVYERMQHQVAPVRVPRDEAPVKQVVVTESDADITRFPATWHHVQDPGRYISAGFLTCYNPETGLENSAITRGWLKGPREIPMAVGVHSHNRLILKDYIQRKQDMPVAYWIGHHPLAILGCAVHVPLTGSHYAMAGAMLGEPLRVVPSETLGEDFLVPADAEVVIEGYIPWDETTPEGPFGEYTRHVGPGSDQSAFMRVTAITHQHNPYWQDIMVGHSHWASSLRHEGVLYDSLKRHFPNLLNVHVPMSGCGQMHVYLQIRKTHEGQGKAVLTAALGMAARINVKNAFVVDEDIDIFDDKEILLALATRFQGDRDMIVISDTVVPELDPSGRKGVGGKVGFDCTKPLSGFAERLRIPDEVVRGLDLEAYVPREALQRIPREQYG
jgi:2,5-furandicarboxylate decarboxylase 1